MDLQQTSKFWPWHLEASRFDGNATNLSWIHPFSSIHEHFHVNQRPILHRSINGNSPTEKPMRMPWLSLTKLGMTTALPCFKDAKLFLRLRTILLLLSLLLSFVQPCVVPSIVPWHKEFLEAFVLNCVFWLVLYDKKYHSRILTYRNLGRFV